MTAIRFERRSADDYTVRFPYDREVVELVKTVPRWARTWNAVTKQWTVDSLYVPELADELRALGHTIVGIGGEKKRNNDTDAPGAWAHMLFTAVGPSRAGAVHRALTKVLHPDTATGDTALQQQLNDAAGLERAR